LSPRLEWSASKVVVASTLPVRQCCKGAAGDLWGKENNRMKTQEPACRER
jgi:hypothetical protein